MATDEQIEQWAKRHGVYDQAKDLRAARLAFEDAASLDTYNESVAGDVKRISRDAFVAAMKRLQENTTVTAQDYLTIGAYVVDLERALKKQ